MNLFSNAVFLVYNILDNMLLEKENVIYENVYLKLFKLTLYKKNCPFPVTRTDLVHNLLMLNSRAD